MKEKLSQKLNDVITSLKTQNILPDDASPVFTVERSKDEKHGDFASNIALTLAKLAKKPPRQLAELIKNELSTDQEIRDIAIAGPGFINFFVNQDTTNQVLSKAISAGDKFGHCSHGQQKKIQIEFVSANPTGPLHVGHGRGAAYGATIADLLQAVGFDVHREYYVNDAGRQMDILAVSVWLRYLEFCGEEITFPCNAYQGDYVMDIAASLHRANQDKFHFSQSVIFADISADEPAGGDKEKHIDDLIAKAQTLLGDKQYQIVFDLALQTVLADIKDDLGHFGVHFQQWYSEKQLTSQGSVDKAIAQLRASGDIVDRDGTLWFKTTDYGDEKDRVVVRKNGMGTYFASDIAYHREKFERGFEQVIDIWGADHHGYIPRVKASIKALNQSPDALTVLLVQFANLYRGKEKLSMSTRSGQFVTLRQLRKDVGKDAARFFYVMRKSEQHLDFDLELATSQSKDNPVYYIQYAHARICSVFRKLADQDLAYDQHQGLESLELLKEKQEQIIIGQLNQFEEIVLKSATQYEPHQLAHYLRALANDFHSYYNAYKVLIEDQALRNARLTLMKACQTIIHNGLKLLGVSAPEEM
jgi:arginyl-tRNA synthetase